MCIRDSYIILNFANVDVIIAKNNISRYFESGQIDTAYLKSLSYDAAPEIQKFFITIKTSADPKEKQMTQELSDYFKGLKSDLESQKSWQSFNISKYKAVQITEIPRNG